MVLPGNGWYSCKLNRTYCNLVYFSSCFIVLSLGMGLLLLIEGPALVSRWVNFSIVWLHTPIQTRPPPPLPPGIFPVSEVSGSYNLYKHKSEYKKLRFVQTSMVSYKMRLFEIQCLTFLKCTFLNAGSRCVILLFLYFK